MSRPRTFPSVILLTAAFVIDVTSTWEIDKNSFRPASSEAVMMQLGD